MDTTHIIMTEFLTHSRMDWTVHSDLRIVSVTTQFESLSLAYDASFEAVIRVADIPVQETHMHLYYAIQIKLINNWYAHRYRFS